VEISILNLHKTALITSNRLKKFSLLTSASICMKRARERQFLMFILESKLLQLLFSMVKMSRGNDLAKTHDTCSAMWKLYAKRISCKTVFKGQSLHGYICVQQLALKCGQRYVLRPAAILSMMIAHNIYRPTHNLLKI
jgi:hypothetical protein